MIRKLRKHAALAIGVATALGVLAALTLITISVYASRLSRLNQELQTTQRHTSALLYAADMNTACQAFRDAQPREVERLLSRHVSIAGQEDLRGVEWHFLNKHIHAPNSIALKGHQGPVYDVAPVDKNWLLISVGEDRIPRVWDYQQGVLVRTCDPADGALHAVAVSPDGKYFVTGNSEIGVWEVQTGKRVRTLKKGLAATLESVAFCHKGDMVAYGTRYHHVGVLTFKNGKVNGEIAEDARHRSIQFSRDDERVWFTSDPNKAGRRVRSMDFRFTTLVKDYADPNNGLTTFVADNQGEWLFCADELTGNLDMINQATGEIVQHVEGQSNGILSIGLSLRNTHLCVGRRNGVLDFYTDNPECLDSDPRRKMDLRNGRRLAVHTAPVFSVIGLIDGRFATCSEDGLIKLSLPPDVTPHVQFEPIMGRYATRIKFDQVNRLARGLDKRRQVWVEDKAGKWSVTGKVPADVVNYLFDVTPDDCLWAIRKGNQCIKVSIKEPDKVLMSIPLQREANGICVSPDGRLAALQHHIDVAVYDLKTGNLRRILKSLDGAGDLYFSPDGRRICLGKSKLEIHAIGEEALTPIIVQVPSELTSLLWSGNDEFISAHQVGEICVWDALTGRQKLAMRGHSAEVEALCLSHDKKTLFSLGRDLKIRAWHLKTGQPLGELFSFDAFDFAEPYDTLAFQDSVLQLRSDGRRLFAHIPSPRVRMQCELSW